MSAESDRLTPAAIIDLSWSICEGKATPEDGRRLMREFCEYVDRNAPVPPPLLEHLSRAFRAILAGSLPTERALGLKRKPGKPATPVEELWEIAADVLRYRLAGDSFEEARAKAAEARGMEPDSSRVTEIWSEHQRDALMLLRIERHFRQNGGWTQEELDRIKEVVKEVDHAALPKVRESN